MATLVIQVLFPILQAPIARYYSITISFEYVDFYAKNYHFLHPPFENSTTKVTTPESFLSPLTISKKWLHEAEQFVIDLSSKYENIWYQISLGRIILFFAFCK